jgi:sigma-B regulation protein RsbU (phosphoserine phosphatase)
MESAKEALEYLRIYEPDGCIPVDLILMDILMPDMNGIQACRIIKEKKEYKDVPIVMVTGMADEENLEMAFEAGIVDYVVKPVKQVEIMAASPWS